MRGQNCCMKCRAIPGACVRRWVCSCHMDKKPNTTPDPFAAVSDTRVMEHRHQREARKA